jgi:mono/diheme cytochrome c family protein
MFRDVIKPAGGILAGVALLSAVHSGAEAPPKPVDVSKLPPPAAQPVDFVRDIQPILAQRCFSCHGGTGRLQGGLRLHRREDALAGGDSGLVIVPGKSAESRLVHYVAGVLDGKVMPPGGPRLTAAQVGLLRAWIDQGAPWPDSADAAVPRSTHWAFQPVKTPRLPRVTNAGWVRNPVDAFVLAKLEAKGLRPSPEADPVTLIRRVTLDLTGLPPTVSEVDAFVRECREEASGVKPWASGSNARAVKLSAGTEGSTLTPNAQRLTPGTPRGNANPPVSEKTYERLVDRLLGSPAYGERWARHWMDLARYADSNGYSIDAPRQMWLWRDWVIRAFNEDLPFDQFTIQQLAGDLLIEEASRSTTTASAVAHPHIPTPPHPHTLPKGADSTGALIATGFHRNTLTNEEGGTDKEQFRVEAVVDRVNTTGTVWLGLTVGCAQCHSHKYDPISQREYYQLFAFFNNADEPSVPFPSPEQGRKQAALERDLAAAQKALADYDRAHPTGKDDKDPGRAALAKRAKALQDAEKDLARDIPTAMVMKELPQPRESFVHLRGDFLRHGIPVRPATLGCLPSLAHGDRAPNRLDLARWLVSRDNPLTPRVTVNRFWQQLFGRGLVETENDFGTQGAPPTHPLLLDWLASVLASGPTSHPESMGVRESGSLGAAARGPTHTLTPPNSHTSPKEALASTSAGACGYECGWSIKRLLKLMVMSSTYRQSSSVAGRAGGGAATPNSKLQTPNVLDPENKLYWRQNRIRLDGEVIRDAALAASGLLSRKIGGPSVFPPQPASLDLFTQVKRNWTPSQGEDRYRRGMYTWHWRSNPYALFAAFDAPNRNVTCTRRPRSNTPLQSLMLANDEGFFEMQQALAVSVLKAPDASDAERLRFAFRRCLAREPSPAEVRRLLDYHQQQVQRFAADPAAAEQAAPKERPAGCDAAQGAAWTAIARVLMNLDEFITRE